MNRLQRINVKGHRRLRELTLDLRPLNVLIGSNGSGKSSLLEVFQILSRGARQQLADSITERGGFSELLTRDHGKLWQLDMLMSLCAHSDNAHETAEPSNIVYHVQLRSNSNFGYFVSEESVTRSLDGQDATNATPILKSTNGSGAGTIRGGFFGSGTSTELELPQNSRSNPTLIELERFLLAVQLLRPIDVSARSPVRLPQQLAPIEQPGANGESLVSSLYALRESSPDRYESLSDTLRAAFPDFERLEFPPVAAGMMSVVWKDRKFTKPLYVSQLSEGTLRFLWLTTALYTSPPNSIILIDEPETSLHPQLLVLLTDLMRETAQRTNLIVATHSDRLVRALQPNEVLIADVDEGEARFSWGDSFDLDHWLADYSLDQLWQMGVIGGRP